jgi:outer membrane lipoprotein-sorting protein
MSNMKISRNALWLLCVALALPRLACGQPTETNSPVQVLSSVLAKVALLVQPPAGEPARTFATTLKIARAEGLPGDLAGGEWDLAFEAPDHLRLAAKWNRESFLLGRNGQEVWLDAPERKFGLIGSPEVAPFSTAPDRKETTPLGPLKLPLPPEQLMLLPLLMDVTPLPDEEVGGARCHVLKATPKAQAVSGFGLPQGTLQLWLRESDSLPLRVGYRDAKGTDVEVELVHSRFEEAWPAEKWKLEPRQGDNIQRVARSHVTRFLDVAFETLGQKVPSLGPATGERRVVGREGNGRLELIDGTRVLFLKGTPEEMGRQHGALLKKEIRDLAGRILYGVGVGSSFEKGSWFFGEIESAQQRLAPFMDERYFREMDALASAAGLSREEVRLSNFFPELFHCSGFALFGRATEGGRLYHGRVLDYLRGFGLEQNAVVMVVQPEQGNAWVNVSYAGMIGTVTAMNEKQVAIGEMGGRGQGRWDGKPMAELLREVMEKANTLDEAVAILRKGPRTCEYYYVVSDAKTKQAVGIAATADKFETIAPGQSHALLSHPIADAVLMSAGDRYEELARRVQAGYGKFDGEGARRLMRRPVCMTSNIHCALFAPDTLDFWVANADSQNVAAHARFTHYNLKELLQGEKAEQASNAR